MTHRERVLKTFQFQQPDRLAFDLTEGSVWRGLLGYFRHKFGLQSAVEVVNFLDNDFRWIRMRDVQKEEPEEDVVGAPVVPDERQTQPKKVTGGILAEARTVQDIERYPWRDPGDWKVPDCREARRLWPDHALVFLTGWMPLFWRACEAFGVEEGLIKLMDLPSVFEAFVKRHHEYYMEILSRGLAAARGYCDICWLGDDFATQQSMMISPELWRKFIRPYLAEQVRLAREHDMYVLFHSCGAVRPVLHDLVDIGVNGLLVFQTTATDMDAESIAREFGGKLVFYGGIDVQQVLSFGTTDDVERTVRANSRAFADCGGYVAANCHSTVATIRPENIHAMCDAAREVTFGDREC